MMQYKLIEDKLDNKNKIMIVMYCSNLCPQAEGIH